MAIFLFHPVHARVLPRRVRQAGGAQSVGRVGKRSLEVEVSGAGYLLPSFDLQLFEFEWRLSRAIRGSGGSGGSVEMEWFDQ